MAILYRYCDREKGMQALRTMRLPASNPEYFNDPFEIRPWFDQERHDYFARTHEAFHARMGSPPFSLIGNRTMVGIPTEDAVDFGEQLNKRFREELGARFRVTCLSRTVSSQLMWGHYTESHQGFVLGIETPTEGLVGGLKSDGFAVRYTEDRSTIRLPLAYYRGISVETYDMRTRRVVNDPNEEVESDGGVIIPFSEYHRRMEEVRIAALSTKALDWAYEQEVRFIFDLSIHANQLIQDNEREYIAIPPAALREVIFGQRTPGSIVKETVDLLSSGRIGSPQLFFSGCHPFRFEVQRHATDPKYLLDYYQVVRPTI